VSRSAAETSQGAAEARGRRKVRVGTVVSEAMAKTVVVRIASQVRHPLYGKIVRRSTKLKAHDETGQAHVGDQVRIVETRPLSKTKRWRVLEVVERAK
jgi:small subunit ribosomal protein S17